MYKSSVWDSEAASALLEYVDKNVLSIIFEFANRGRDRWARKNYWYVVNQIDAGMYGNCIRTRTENSNAYLKSELCDLLYLSYLQELEKIHTYTKRYNVRALKVVKAFTNENYKSIIGLWLIVNNHVRNFYCCICEMKNINPVGVKINYLMYINCVNSHITRAINEI